jgi:hypothetical protein
MNYDTPRTVYDLKESTPAVDRTVPVYASDESTAAVYTGLRSSPIYGFCGFAGSGKNTAASFLLNHTHGQAHSFAGPLKDAVAVIFGWSREMLEGDTPESRAWRDQPDAYWSSAFKRIITPRIILQEVGTDVFRHYLPNMWVEAAGRRTQSNTAAVFTDTRFGNEMSWITSQNGVLIWVYRPEIPHLLDTTTTLIRGFVDRHENLSNPDIVPQIRQACQADTVHSSETSFLHDGPQRPHVVVKNTSTTDALSLMMRHIHTLYTTTGMKDFPWGTETLYLSVLGEQCWWEWRNELGHDSYRAYAKNNVCVLQGTDDGG